jgi:flagellar hook assembly protein FlgD
LRVYDAAGRTRRTVFEGPRAAGVYLDVWDGRDAEGERLPNGIYFAKLLTEGTTEVRKVILTR